MLKNTYIFSGILIVKYLICNYLIINKPIFFYKCAKCVGIEAQDTHLCMEVKLFKKLTA